ncbi:RidA family protein [Microbacterium sp. LWH7-1.2]|uniref:RidA family protein n=1 Tax=Microbacterium sp. LWH7-1.2 TaxID=3135257 RepID=UPI00313A2CA0
MQKIRHTSPDVREPEAGMWSNCLSVGEFIFISGLTARGTDGSTILGSDSYEQSGVIFRKMRALVEAAGAAMDDVVQMTIFVTDMSENAQVWRARREFFTGDFPTCALVEVAALAKDEIRVEVQATAVRGSSTAPAA